MTVMTEKFIRELCRGVAGLKRGALYISLAIVLQCLQCETLTWACLVLLAVRELVPFILDVLSWEV